MDDSQYDERDNDIVCIETDEFEQAIKLVSEHPYDETAKDLQEMTQYSIQQYIANGGPSPEEYVRRRASGNKR